jgi:hypothetical protein
MSIPEIQIDLPTYADTACIRRSGSMTPRATHYIAPRLYHYLVHQGAPQCLEHPEVQNELEIDAWHRITDTIICDELIKKTNHGHMIREPSDHWWRSVEEANDQRAQHGDTFLVRSDRRHYDYSDPMKHPPADWKPCAGSIEQQYDERMRVYQTLNKDRVVRSCTVIYDYFTVRTRSNRWRRKMVAYEDGTPSPFMYQYFDARDRY